MYPLYRIVLLYIIILEKGSVSNDHVRSTKIRGRTFVFSLDECGNVCYEDLIGNV